MESRLVLLVLFLAVTAGIFSLKSYRNNFDPSVSLKNSIEPKKEEAQADIATEATTEFVLELNTPQLKSGHDLYIAKNCTQCHGDKGQGVTDQQGPVIAGQYDWYIADQVNQIKKGIRKNDKMQPFVSGLTDQEINDIAHYVSALRLRK
jgi:cytochrome c553